MTQCHRLKRKRLSDLLVDEGLATKEVVIAGLHAQKDSGVILSSVLLAENDIDAFDLARVLVEHFQVPFVDLERYALHKDVIKLFPAELLHRARMVPLEKFGKHYSFACQEIPSREIHEEIKKIVDGSVLVFAAFSRDIDTVLREFAPYETPKPEGDTAEVELADEIPSQGNTDDANEDQEWQALFDTANESIVSKLDESDSE